MPWNLTVEIMLPPRGSNQNSWDTWDTVAAGFGAGGIVACYDHIPVGTVPAMPRTGYVFVTDVPDTVTLDRVRDILSSPERDILDGRILSDRKVHFGKTRIPASAKRDLINIRYVTVPWSLAVPYIEWIASGQTLTEGDFV